MYIKTHRAVIVITWHDLNARLVSLLSAKNVTFQNMSVRVFFFFFFFFGGGGVKSP